MPIFSSIQAIGPLGARKLIAKLKAFTDNFTRSNSTTALGNTNAEWTALTGTWGITSNRAYSVTAGSSYPVAVFDAKTPDVVVKADGTLVGATSAGYGVAFWAVDGNNWYGAHTEKSTFTAAPYNCPNGGTAYGSNCNYGYGASGGPYMGTACPCGSQFGGDCYNCCWVFCGKAYETGIIPNPYNCPSGGSLSGATCYVTYGGTISTWYKHDVKVVKKVGGTVSVVSTLNPGNIVANASSHITYVQANTVGSNVVITAGLSNGYTYTSSPITASETRGTFHGMLTGPATINTTTEIETFTYTPN